MEYPIKVFEIGSGQEYVKMEILEAFGFPKTTSFRGGYDVRCRLEIKVGVYACYTENYYTATGALYDFYVALQDCYDKLSGKVAYSVRYPENDLVLEVEFTHKGAVYVNGKYRDNPTVNDVLYFELVTDQSYFKDVLSDLKKIILAFGDKKGVKK